MNLSCFDIASVSLGSFRRKGGEFAFLCPNHNDSNPSLLINTKKDCWMCGPCDSAGGAWKLAAFIAGVSPNNTREIADWLRRNGL